MLSHFQADLRHSLRMLGKSPGFTALAVATLSLAIGLNTALFSVVNAVLLRPLPVAAPETLVGVFNTSNEGLLTHTPMAFPDFRDLRAQVAGLTGAFGYSLEPMALEAGGRNEMVMSEAATGDYFTTLGVHAALGRTFTAADEEGADASPVAVLGHRAWQRRFGGDPSIVGSTIRLNGRAYTVAGVAQPEFTGLYRMLSTEFWVPMRWAGARRQSALEDRGSRWLFAMGRLRPGVPLAQAQQEAAAAGKRMQELYPESNRDRDVGLLPIADVKVMPGLERVLYPVSAVLLAVVGLVLLIACANVANMLLARSLSRRKEFVTRLALGAPRGRVVRQLLVESLVLAVAGAAGGLLLAFAGNAAVVRVLNGLTLPVPLTLTLGPALDGRVLAYVLGLVLLTTVAFGLAPALESTRAGLSSALQEASVAVGGGRKRRLQGSLVVAQTALSLVLLIGAGLAVRSLWNARGIDPGFTPRGVATATLSPELALDGVERQQAFFAELLARVRALPGVESAALASQLPLTLEIRTNRGVAEGGETVPREQWPELDMCSVGPDYFAAMGIRIHRGREFRQGDISSDQRLVVVSETLAERFWPGQDPIGRRLFVADDEQPWEVVGVAAAAKHRTLGEAPRPYLYQVFRAADHGDATVIARTGGDASALVQELRRLSNAIDPQVPIRSLRTLEQAISVSLLLPRAGASLFGMFGLLGLILASVGLYGVMSCVVSQRAREFGIRMSLGAQRGDIVGLALRQGLRLSLLGVAIGLAGAVAMTRVLGAILYGISPTDAATFAAVAALLLVTSLVACHVPARRASRVDPVVVLRGD